MSSEKPNFLSQPVVKNIFMFRNGDPYFEARRIVINEKRVCNFETLLREVTGGIQPPFGAVRNIYTPRGGHRVERLESLQSGEQYVAAGKERFKKLDYQEIGPRKKKMLQNLPLQARPLPPNRIIVSARFLKPIKEPITIFVVANGDVLNPAIRMLIHQRMMGQFEKILELITEKMGLRVLGGVRSLYSYEGHQVTDGNKLECGQLYVAVGRERFKKLPYSEILFTRPKGTRRIKGIKAYSLPPIYRFSKQRGNSKSTVRSSDSGDGDSKGSPPNHSGSSKEHLSSAVREISQARLLSLRKRKSGQSFTNNDDPESKADDENTDGECLLDTKAEERSDADDDQNAAKENSEKTEEKVETPENYSEEDESTSKEDKKEKQETNPEKEGEEMKEDEEQNEKKEEMKEADEQNNKKEEETKEADEENEEKEKMNEADEQKNKKEEQMKEDKQKNKKEKETKDADEQKNKEEEMKEASAQNNKEEEINEAGQQNVEKETTGEGEQNVEGVKGEEKEEVTEKSKTQVNCEEQDSNSSATNSDKMQDNKEKENQLNTSSEAEKEQDNRTDEDKPEKDSGNREESSNGNVNDVESGVEQKDTGNSNSPAKTQSHNERKESRNGRSSYGNQEEDVKDTKEDDTKETEEEDSKVNGGSDEVESQAEPEIKNSDSCPDAAVSKQEEDVDDKDKSKTVED